MKFVRVVLLLLLSFVGGPSLATEVVYTPVIKTGWNLMGNALDITIPVSAVAGSSSAPISGVISVWAYNRVDKRWRFYSPLLTPEENSAHVVANGYESLVSIGPGEGYWVNSVSETPIVLPDQVGIPFAWNSDPFSGRFWFGSLSSEWSMIATASAISPARLNLIMGMDGAPPMPGDYYPSGNEPVFTSVIVSLWAWDTTAGKWYFYSPLIEAVSGLSGVRAYAESHSYLDFIAGDPENGVPAGKTLGLGVGFWVNRP